MEAKVVKMRSWWFRKRPYLVMYREGAFGTFRDIRSAAKAAVLVRENPELVSAPTSGVK